MGIPKRPESDYAALAAAGVHAGRYGCDAPAGNGSSSARERSSRGAPHVQPSGFSGSCTQQMSPWIDALIAASA